MGWPLRVLSSKKIYHICSRTKESRIWFLPSKEFENIFGSIIARAAARYEIKLYGVSVLGNHFHLLLQGRKKRIPKFMKDLKSALAAATKRIYGWEDGKLWHRRYDCEVVFEDKLVHMYCYVNANAVSSYLVSKGDEYKGLSGYHQAITGTVPTYTWTDWANFRKDKANKGRYKHVDIKNYQRNYALQLAPLPIWKHLSKEKRLSIQKKALENFEREYAKKRQLERKNVFGILALSRIKPGFRPFMTKKAPRPLCHTACPKRRYQFKKWYQAICVEYKKISKQFLSGVLNVDFPVWTFHPPAWTCRT